MNLPEQHSILPLQELMIRSELEDPEHLSNVITCLKISGAVSLEEIEAAVQTCMDLQQALRIRFSMTSGDTIGQMILPHDAVKIEYFNRTNHSAESIKEELTHFGNNLLLKAFDILGGQLCRFALFDAGKDQKYLYVHVHHAIFDGWSTHLLFEDLANILVHGRSNNGENSGFLEFVNWINSSDGYTARERAIKFWQDYMSDLKPERITRQQRVREASCIKKITQPISRKVSQAVRGTVNAHDGTITQASLLLACFLLTDASEHRDRVGCASVPLKNRTIERDKRAYGIYSNVVPIFASLDPKMQLSDYLRAVRKDMLSIYEHQRISLASVMHCAPDFAFERPRSLFNFLPYARNAYETSNRSVHMMTEILPPILPTWCDLGFDVFSKQNESFEIGVSYFSDVLSAEAAGQIADRFVRVVESVTSGKASTVDDVIK